MNPAGGKIKRPIGAWPDGKPARFRKALSADGFRGRGHGKKFRGTAGAAFALNGR
jgi:hypothetical protein